MGSRGGQQHKQKRTGAQDRALHVDAAGQDVRPGGTGILQPTSADHSLSRQRTRRCHTPRYTTSRGVYDEINLWKAAGRRAREFRAACSLFATICVAFQLLFFATFVVCNFCGFTLVPFALSPRAGQITYLPRFLVHDCDAGKFKGPSGGVSELAACHCNIMRP